MSELQENQTQKASIRREDIFLADDSDTDVFPKNQALGKPPLSLRDYIAKHLQDAAQSPEEAQAEELSDKSGKGFNVPLGQNDDAYSQFIATYKPPEQVLDGYQLNNLDTEFRAGIEQYLPTPITRYRVIKDRLHQEIRELTARLEKYEKIAQHSSQVNKDVEAHIQKLQEKLNSLKHHEALIESELAAYFSQESLVFQVLAKAQDVQEKTTEIIDTVTSALSVESLISQTNPERQKLAALNTELEGLTEVMVEQLERPQMGYEEVSAVLNQYDQALPQIDALIEKLQNKPTLKDQLQEKFRKVSDFIKLDNGGSQA